MKDNQNVFILGSRCELIPYGKEHVETYHEWMKDPFLQGEKTAW